ncbi:MAG: DUF2752 domain-containing protein [Candidatus Dadabacteria bacterium]
MRKYSECILWSIALVLLFAMDDSQQHYSFCLFRMMGWNSCPGCGIGHAIHDVLHLQFTDSLKEHFLGIPATIAILYSIIKPLLSIKQTKLTWTLNK